MDDPSSVTNQLVCKNSNTMADMEKLTIDNVHHRTPSDVENNNNFNIYQNSSESSSSITTINANIQNLTLEENKTFIEDPETNSTNINMPYYHTGPDGFSNIIVNIIDGDGNVDAKVLSDDEYKDGAFSPKTPDSCSRTPRSKSNSLNSDQLLSQLR